MSRPDFYATLGRLLLAFLSIWIVFRLFFWMLSGFHGSPLGRITRPDDIERYQRRKRDEERHRDE